MMQLQGFFFVLSFLLSVSPSGGTEKMTALCDVTKGAETSLRVTIGVGSASPRPPCLLSHTGLTRQEVKEAANRGLSGVSSVVKQKET